MAQDEQLTGVVDYLACQKPTFVAGRLKSGGRSVSFSAHGCCNLGDTVTVTGSWETHSKYGKQFKGKSISISLPLDREGLARWLNWYVPHIGPVKAARLLDEFGVELMDRMVSDPELVAIAARVPLESIQDAAKRWQDEGNRIRAMSWLAGHGLSEKQVLAILARYGPTAPVVVEQDPYQLIGEVEGCGWVTVEAIAKTLGIGETDPRRIRGALAAVVRESYDNGSTCVQVQTAANMMGDRLGVREQSRLMEWVSEAVGHEACNVTRFGDGTAEGDYLATKWAIRCERGIWSALKFSRHANPLGEKNAERARAIAEQYRQTDTLTLDDEQVEAIANALQYRISITTGGAGCGKTSVCKMILKCFADADVQTALCAPTGKAARRMTEVIGHPASTIHKLLEYNGGTRQFMRNELDPLCDTAIIVDECSMIDSEILYRLLQAVGNNCSLVLIGDPNQLPPVGAGNPLRDILAYNLAPIVQLEKVHRQAGPLKVNSMAILTGKVANTCAEGVSPPWVVNNGIGTREMCEKAVAVLYSKYLPEWGYTGLDDWQFVTAKHDGWFGTKRLNLILQHLHQKKLGNPLPFPHETAHEERIEIYHGDKVIQTRNDYNLNVMNGETGIVLAKNPTRRQLLHLLGVPDDEFTAATANKVTAPIHGSGTARTCDCPVCGSRIAIDRAGGWLDFTCESCGSEFSAVDGTELPTPVDLDAPGVKDALAARVQRDEQPVADYVVSFPDRVLVYPVGNGGDLQIAYCLTVHRMQGSQTPCVICVVPKANAFMQNRNWFYTAVTRAMRTCVVMGDSSGIGRAAEKIVIDERKTLLQVFAADERAKRQ